LVAIPVVTGLPMLVLGIVVKDMCERTSAAGRAVEIDPIMTAFTVACVGAVRSGLARRTSLMP